MVLYSSINSYFDRMRFKYEAIREHNGKPIDKERYAYSVTSNELEEFISGISKIIGEKYYLSITDRMPKLRQMLITEYNTRIKPEYERLTETKIDEIY